jgi:hypothetical protein
LGDASNYSKTVWDTVPFISGVWIYHFFGIEPVIINITFKTCASFHKFSFKKVLPVMVLVNVNFS